MPQTLRVYKDPVRALLNCSISATRNHLSIPLSLDHFLFKAPVSRNFLHSPPPIAAMASDLSDKWRAYLRSAEKSGTLPSVSRGIIGFGPAGFTLVLSMVADTISERHMVEEAGGALPVIKRIVTIFEDQVEKAAGGGGAYYEQDGALNSGFADTLTLLDRKLLKQTHPSLDYTPFLELVDSLQSYAREWVKDKIPDLLEQYAQKNQLGANLLVAALRDDTLDATRACFLRRTVSDIFYEMYRKLKAFVDEHVPELDLRFHFEAMVFGAEILPGNRLRIRATPDTSDAPEGTYEFDSVVNTSGARVVDLLSKDILPHAFHGPANSDGIRRHIAKKGFLDHTDKVHANTRFLIVGTLLHGIDQLGALSTVIGANTCDASRREPWFADKEFARRTGITVTMLSRSEANLPPPRLAHDIVMEGRRPLLTDTDAQAFTLFYFDDFPAYKQVKEVAIASRLGIHPNELPTDRTTAEQLQRFLREIRDDDEGKVTYTSLERKFAFAREFRQYPSADPEKAQSDAEAAFPATIRLKTDWYNSRHDSLTSPTYLAKHSNAATMEADLREYVNFAAPPKSSMRILGEHQESGLLKFTTGDIRTIEYDEGSGVFKLGEEVYDILIAPGIITSELDPVMQSLYPHLKKDEHDNVEYASGRQLKLKNDTLLPFFDYGNNSSGRRWNDVEGRSSVSGRHVRDVATLFAKFTSMPVVSAMINMMERFALQREVAPCAAMQDVLSSLRPDEGRYLQEVEKARSRVRNAQELELYLRLIRANTTLTEWSQAYHQADTADSRKALMMTWANGTSGQKALAQAYLDGLKTLPSVEAKTLDDYWKQFIDPPVRETQLAMRDMNVRAAK